MKRRIIWLFSALVTFAAGLGSGALARAPAEQLTNQWAGIRVFESEEQERSPEQAAAEQRLVQQIKARLEADPWVRSYQLSIAARKGIVALSGTVDNLLAKERAVQLAGTIAGVREVQNYLNVSLPLLPDVLLANQAAAILVHNPVLRTCSLKTEAQNGFITLSGIVDSAYRKELAAMLAKGLAGVRQVENKLRVVYVASRPDDEIQADVSSRLQWDPWLNNPQVNVRVLNGKVVLNGLVQDAKARNRVFKDAWVAGVNSVDVSGVTLLRTLPTAPPRAPQH